tara:strand:- start:133 stop:339 length:207 start_codon:yes stop_codon:yes gene_type:complete
MVDAYSTLFAHVAAGVAGAFALVYAVEIAIVEIDFDDDFYTYYYCDADVDCNDVVVDDDNVYYHDVLV